MYVARKLEDAGFKLLKLGEEKAKLVTGDKFYYINKGKNILFGMVGQTMDAFTIIGTHMDVPHLDLMPVFLQDVGKAGACVLKTVEYGGIKRYEYATTPMIMKIAYNDGNDTKLYSIGDQPDDPIFTIPDLLIHLKKPQAERKMPDVVKADELNALVGTSKG